MPAQPESAGRVIAGRYALMQALGSGGSGAVYLATDTQTATSCAVKILSSTLGDSLDLLRFKREFRAASRLQHPHCVRVLEHGEVDGSAYITMEYMAGGDLSKEVGASSETVVGIILQILAALDHIHAKGIIHRDIKLQNILLCEPSATQALPHAKLSDFGIAKVGDFEDTMSAGAALGSLSHMAPEQLIDGVSDPRSDLYALGTVLYETLSGVSPVAGIEEGTVAAWVVRRGRWVIPELQTVAPHVPAELAAIVMGLLQTSPSLRPRTAADAYHALHAWLVPRISWTLPAAPALENQDYLAMPAFVGRAAEAAKLDRFLDGVGRSDPQAPLLLCLSGKAGMGKSKLINHLVRRAEVAQTLVEVATCRAEPGPAFEPIASLLSALTQIANGTITQQPESAVASSQPATGDNQGGALWELYRQMSDALITFASTNPCLIVLEDAQWADPHTLRLFTIVLRNAAVARRQGKALSLGIVITHRFADEHTALSEIYEVATSLQTLDVITLGPLKDDDATELVASMLTVPVTPDLAFFTQRLTTSGENNPLFIAQILRALLSKGLLYRQGTTWQLGALDTSDVTMPASISAAVGERAARFSIYTKELLAAASVMGRRFDIETVLRVTEFEEPVLLDSLEEAVRADFIAEDSGDRLGFIFGHDRFREAIYENLTESQRRNWHHKVAKAIVHFRGDAPEFAGDLARHWRACGELEQAMRSSVIAAQYANTSFAYEQAATLYRQAVQDCAALAREPSRELKEAYADACTHTGWYKESADIYRELLTHRSADKRIDILRKLGDIEFLRARLEAAEALQYEALDLLQVSVPRTRFGLFLGIIWHAACGFLGVRPAFLRKTPLQGEAGHRWENIVETCHTLSRVYFLNDLLRGAYFALAAGTAARKRGPSVASTGAMATAGAFWIACGAFKLARRHTQLARVWGTAAHAEAGVGWAITIDTMCSIAAGDMQAAIASGREAEQILSKARMPSVLRSALEFHGEALLAAGQPSAALRKASELWKLSDEIDDIEGRGWARGLEGLALLRMHDQERGMTALREAVSYCLEAGSILYSMVAAARLHLELALLGTCDVETLLTDSLVYTQRNLRSVLSQMDAAFLIGTALHVRAKKELSAAAHQHLRLQRRVRRLDNWSNKATRPMILTGLAAWDLLDGKVSAAKSGFERGIEHARRLGMAGELVDVLRVVCAMLPEQDPQRAVWAQELARLDVTLT